MINNYDQTLPEENLQELRFMHTLPAFHVAFPRLPLTHG